MNEEIKEILEDFKNDIENNIFLEVRASYYKPLLDYITNLETIEKQYSAILSENAELENKITNLEQENEILKEQNVCVGCNNNPDYKSRCKRAIEYIKLIKNNTPSSTRKDFGKMIPLNYELLLNILTGGGEE